MRHDNLSIAVSRCVFCDQQHSTDYACEEFKYAMQSLTKQGKTLTKEESIKLKASKR